MNNDTTNCKKKQNNTNVIEQWIPGCANYITIIENQAIIKAIFFPGFFNLVFIQCTGQKRIL